MLGQLSPIESEGPSMSTSNSEFNSRGNYFIVRFPAHVCVNIVQKIEDQVVRTGVVRLSCHWDHTVYINLLTLVLCSTIL